MIILDTNLVSELVRLTPSPAVLQWAHAQAWENIFTTTVCEAELLFGVLNMAAGRRRDRLHQAIDVMLNTVLVDRVLPFDRAAARHYATLAARCRRDGAPVGAADLQIAAIALARGASAIATRNTRDFAHCGVPLVDPWAA